MRYLPFYADPTSETSLAHLAPSTTAQNEELILAQTPGNPRAIHILNSMTVWAICRKKYSINDRNVAPIETGETLKELIWEQVRKSWNTTCFMKGDRRKNGQGALRTLWAEDRLAKFDLEQLLLSNSDGMSPGCIGVGGFQSVGQVDGCPTGEYRPTSEPSGVPHMAHRR